MTLWYVSLDIENDIDNPCDMVGDNSMMSCHVMSCHVMSCHVMSCHVMSCDLL
jgi:cell division ATPase FtsA